MMYYTYILENQSGNLYIGQTNNTISRLARHNSNRVQSTKNKGPWKIVFSKEHCSRKESMQYESYLKSLKNNVYIRKEIIGK